MGLGQVLEVDVEPSGGFTGVIMFLEGIASVSAIS